MQLKYNSVEELVAAASSSNKKISEIVLEQQAEDMETSKETVYSTMENSFEVMRQSVLNGMDETLRSSSGLSGGAAAKLKKAVDEGKNHYGHLLGNAISMALAVTEYNSCMGQIVAAPTAGSCGVIPSALISVLEEFDLPKHDIIMSLFTASAIGMVIAKCASIAGAEGGCQAEVGSASAMAAAALTEIFGGTPQMVSDSCAIALKNTMGLVCDPVAGLVEVPCIKRNAMGVANAFTASELACAGITSAIPADEVILAMKQVGDLMSTALKETSEGGLAATPTGCRLRKQIFGTDSASS
ncbi:L-serine ammonia-lyase, iron-sulfur-dependent, subunit alpha [Lacrimispora celerecrescens]|uniref:L-serine dehydratase n=1 Tax=Lacrimispora celerecrescens TaxID=29354 RepID=A0A084JMA2_9FIRM|nr:L-serine ammonia-lyase, iron-sulfur-dependent, subunit alpha [Lacrimispora celerecrescens]KEZ90086.1 serine dehydratase [Lacrimispora celerecrescens]MBW4846953.1 L-serine ammonia-lyase, iron-sulfur-dependent, subunit alpha [Lachnospiraceae bacterium]